VAHLGIVKLDELLVTLLVTILIAWFIEIGCGGQQALDRQQDRL
jgi:hypothetical protein